MVTIFEFDSYKSYLKAHLRENAGNRGYQARLAKAAGCQASYLTQALNTKVELTPDHGFRICQFLQLSSLESDFFLHLLQLSRANSPELKRHFSKKMNELKAAYRSLSERVATPTAPQLEVYPEYYSSWLFMAIPSALEVGSYSTPEALAKRFGRSQETIEHALRALDRMGLAKARAGIWKANRVDRHLPAKNFMNSVSHRNWRDRALLDIDRQTPDSLHYTSVFSMSRVESEALRTRILEWIEGARELIKPSPSEEVYCMLCDFFEV